MEGNVTINFNLAYVCIALLSGMCGFFVGWLSRPTQVIIDKEVILCAAEALLDEEDG